MQPWACNVGLRPRVHLGACSPGSSGEPGGQAEKGLPGQMALKSRMGVVLAPCGYQGFDEQVASMVTWV